MKTEITSLWPVLTLVIGWFLNEISSKRRTNQDQKKAISVAVSDLLEIRHEIIATTESFNTIISSFNIPHKMLPEVFKMLRELDSDSGDFNKRFNQTVTRVAEFDPIMGFKLRSKDIFKNYMANVATANTQCGDTAKIYNEMTMYVGNSIIPNIEKSILTLSRKHSFFTFLRVRKLLRASQAAPKEALELVEKSRGKFDSLMTELNRAEILTK